MRHIMKKIVVLGVGAQGSTVVKRMDDEDGVREILCVDYDQKAVDDLVKITKKGRGVRVNAHDTQSIIDVARGVDLIVNALPLEFAPNVLEAALAVGSDYQDFALTGELDKEFWPNNARILYDDYGKRFRDAGKLAIIGTGSAPGVICVASRDAMRYLDACEEILMLVYEGVEAKRFLTFWWSPLTALNDMTHKPTAYIDGKLVNTEPYGLPVYRHFKGCSKEVMLVEHSHDEPVYMGYNAETHFKGAKNIYFKYGGVGVDFAHPLFRAGLLSHDEEEINGRKVVPFDVVLAHMPPAPKYKDEIAEILAEGLVSDEGACVVEAIGTKDGKRVRVETYVMAPGCVESFKRAEISGEQYMTGQCGAMFTKMLVYDKIDQTGLISSDMLTFEEVDYYLEHVAEWGVTLSTEVKEL
jgi:saccharopine dehydrogenase-like NADP-dependent oxidoreductase